MAKQPEPQLMLSRSTIIKKLNAKITDLNARELERTHSAKQSQIANLERDLAKAKADLKNLKAGTLPPDHWHHWGGQLAELKTAIQTLECFPTDQIPLATKSIKLPFHLL